MIKFLLAIDYYHQNLEQYITLTSKHTLIPFLNYVIDGMGMI